MSSPTRHRGALAAVRGGLLAVSSGTLAVTAHAVAGGGVPDPALTLLLTGLLGWTATAVAGKARGPVATVVVLGAGQLVMHLVLTVLAAHEMPPATGWSGGWAMTASHAVATVLTALLLARADRMLLAVLHVVRAFLPLLTRALPVPAAAPAPIPPRPARAAAPLRLELRRVHGRRGPPVFS
ncbi:hypothetical protein SAMN04489732_13225 [Amycolatopsis saalfeldensis]|uniref:Uncharacterized protein n=1 Tax=Amycolatopsis saalfeldensis TaxID=394193 RepID=A0A1H8YNR3_9PSEU|nr:hypothetical protein [Amycolatopsis saalfeldensis]SEP53844.1 hypothetical protein SAMN04489732_13225 [Amycolatopsis saalfeldensis]